MEENRLPPKLVIRPKIEGVIHDTENNVVYCGPEMETDARYILAKIIEKRLPAENYCEQIIQMHVETKYGVYVGGGQDLETFMAETDKLKIKMPLWARFLFWITHFPNRSNREYMRDQKNNNYDDFRRVMYSRGFRLDRRKEQRRKERP